MWESRGSGHSVAGTAAKAGCNLAPGRSVAEGATGGADARPCSEAVERTADVDAAA